MRREYPTGAGLRAPTLSTKSLTKSEASGPSPDGMQYSIILSLKGENCENRSSDDTQHDIKLWVEGGQGGEPQPIDGKMNLLVFVQDKQALFFNVVVCCVQHGLQRHQTHHLRSRHRDL